MNIKSNLLIAATLLVGGFGFTSSALAIGEGGVAGAASFQLTTSVVQRASVAVAVGKTTAYAGASTITDAFQTAAFATGTGGALTTGASAPYSLTTISEESAAGLVVAQANTITKAININVITGVAAITP